jgi:HEAT repeat protein
MLNYDNFAITLGRAVDLFRHRPDAVPELKGALRALVALTGLGGATLRVEDGKLLVSDTEIGKALPGVSTLVAQMEAHDLREIQIEKDSSPAAMLQLLRTLAVPLGGLMDGQDPVTRFRASQAVGISVVVGADLPRAEVQPREARPSGDPRVRSALSEAVLRAPSLSRPERAVAAIALDPYVQDLSARLEVVAAHVNEELAHGRISGAIRAVAQLIQLEETAPTVGVRALFRDALTPLLTPTLLADAADAALHEGHRSAAVRVLQRSGVAGTYVLRDRLLRADEPDVRRRYLILMRSQVEGLRSLILLLQDPDVQLVRRVAEILGSLGVREAVPALSRVLSHSNPAVREAVAVALARIGVPAAEQLRQILDGDDPGLRLCVARAIGDASLASLAEPLARLGLRERNADLRSEFARALGRIGTPDAVATLVRWAMPPRWQFWRRRTGLRVAAIDGLRLAAGQGAVSGLRELTGDRDREVRRSAREALEDLAIAGPGSGP